MEYNFVLYVSPTDNLVREIHAGSPYRLRGAVPHTTLRQIIILPPFDQHYQPMSPPTGGR